MKKTKRVFDVCCASIGLLILWPLFISITVVILLDSGKPVLFRQERVGFKGELFKMWKFRTMKVDEGDEKLLTVDGDPRVTRSGKWLRKMKLDELPQLVNVLRGEMSMVGPRPEVEKYVQTYNREQRKVLKLVPGITDPASNKYRNEAQMLADAEDPEALYTSEIMNDKIELNLKYAESATVWSDTVEILRTLVGLFGN